MRLKAEHLKYVLENLDFSSNILKDLHQEYNGDTTKILKEHFGAETAVVYNQVKTEITGLNSKYSAWENRKHLSIEYPEIHVWDEYRDFIIDFLGIKTYLELKDIISDLFLEIGLFILENKDGYEFPNKLGLLKLNKPLRQKSKAHNNKHLVKNRITRLSYKSYLLSKHYKLIPRDRFKLLTIIDYLNKRKFETC